MKIADTTFQRYMDTHFANVPNVCVYLDYLFIASDYDTEQAADL